MHIGFWILRIARRSHWNNFYNITKAPALLLLSPMKRISGSSYFLHQLCRTSQWPNYISLFECKLVWVFRPVDIRIIYSSITQSLKFHLSIQITWKHKAAGKSDLLEQALIFAQLFSFLTIWGRWVIFKKQISKQPFTEVLQNRFSYRKTPLSKSLLISLQRAVFWKWDSGTGTFFWVL